MTRKAKSPTSTPPTVAPIAIGEGANGASEGGAWENAPVVQTAGLTVSEEIARVCGIEPKAGAQDKYAARFEFDSAALGQDDREMLGKVAKCMTEGALKGKNVALIGRADARGEDEYNMTLGESRADAVQRYLRDLGVGRDHMKATSRGEIDATGKNEQGWAQDRRVDVELAR